MGPSEGRPRNRSLLFQSSILAAASNILKKATRVYPTENRGVKRNNYHVLRENRRPAVLCELGFLSNRQDNRYAQSAQYRQRLAESVAAGIVVERQSAER